MKDLSDLNRFKMKDADTLAQEQATTDSKLERKHRQKVHQERKARKARKEQAPPRPLTQSLGELLKEAGLG